MVPGFTPRTAESRAARLAGILACLVSIGGCNQRSIAVDPAPASEQTPIDDAATDRIDGKPLSAMLHVAPGGARVGDTLELSVSLRVAPLWVIGALDARPETAATKLELELPTWLEAQDTWQAPPTAGSLTPDGHPAYANEAVFKRNLVVKDGATAGKHAVGCRVTYQACDQRQCLQPAAIALQVQLRVE
jgi:hypothetical protein